MAKFSLRPVLPAAALLAGPYDGGGDCTIWITANNQTAFIATPFAPGGVVMDYLARVPLAILR